jgi:hypothetical protein
MDAPAGLAASAQVVSDSSAKAASTDAAPTTVHPLEDTVAMGRASAAVVAYTVTSSDPVPPRESVTVNRSVYFPGEAGVNVTVAVVPPVRPHAAPPTYDATVHARVAMVPAELVAVPVMVTACPAGAVTSDPADTVRAGAPTGAVAPAVAMLIWSYVMRVAARTVMNTPAHPTPVTDVSVIVCAHVVGSVVPSAHIFCVIVDPLMRTRDQYQALAVRAPPAVSVVVDVPATYFTNRRTVFVGPTLYPLAWVVASTPDPRANTRTSLVALAPPTVEDHRYRNSMLSRSGSASRTSQDRP